MSELQESQRPISAGAKNGAGPAPKPNPSIETNPAVASSTGQGISGTNNTNSTGTTGANTTAPQPYTPVFTTDKIQHTKATRPKDYFDEQNKKNAEKKKRDTKNRRNIIIIGAAIVGSLVLIGLIWFIVIKLNEPKKGPTGQDIPSISSNSSEEVNKVQRYLQNVYDDYDNNGDSSNNNNAKLEATNEAASEILAHGNNADYASQIALARIMFYVNNGFYNEAVAEIDNVNVDNLTMEQQATYYNCLGSAYQALGDQTKSNEYMILTYNISAELGGAGGSDDE